MTPGYRIFDHTADVGLEAWGRTPAEAFVAAARGMFAILLGADPAEWHGSGRPLSPTVEVAGADWSALLVNWLAELLFHFEVDGLIPFQISMLLCEPPRCVAQLEGRALAGAEELAGVGVKAVTYHELRVEVGAERTDVRVIFDI